MSIDYPDGRFWSMGGDDPDGRPFGIVDEKAGGIVAYAASLDHAERLVELLNRAVETEAT